MWLLDNQTPYAAERNWTRDASGTHWWIVAVRGTFSVGSDGRPALDDGSGVVVQLDVAVPYDGLGTLGEVRAPRELLTAPDRRQLGVHRLERGGRSAQRGHELGEAGTESRAVVRPALLKNL